MPQLLANNAAALLTSTIDPVATELTIEAGVANLFRVATTANWSSPDDWFKVTLEDDAGHIEIIHVGLHADGSPIFSNVLRGQEGTAARAWTAGQTVVENRVTRADFEAVMTYGFGARADISTNTANFNNLTASGAYALTGDGTWAGSANAPTNAPANGQLDVFTSGAAIVQKVETFNPETIWRRSKVAATWSSWKRVDSVQSLSSKVGEWINDFAGVARVFLTSAGATILKGYGVIPFTVQRADGAAVLQLSSAGVLSVAADAAANGDVTRLGQVAALLAIACPTGKIGHFYDTAAPAGWVEARADRTIGSADSGASRAHADTAALYAKVWAVATNVITTATGAAATRGASAAADFAANKRLALPEMRAEWIRGADQGRGVAPDMAVGAWADHQVPLHKHNRILALSQGRTDGPPDQYISTGAPTYGASWMWAETDSVGGEGRVRSVAALTCLKL